MYPGDKGMGLSQAAQFFVTVSVSSYGNSHSGFLERDVLASHPVEGGHKKNHVFPLANWDGFWQHDHQREGKVALKVAVTEPPLVGKSF